MAKITHPKEIDYLDYAVDLTSPSAKYGLPTNVQFCSKCVISNQRPSSAIEFRHTAETEKCTIGFDDDQVCDACRFADEKQSTINWQDRERQLIELCDKHRRTDGRHDCIVPGSGGKDSFFTAHQLKYKYNMNPLTVTWAPHIYTEWGWRNFQKWIHAGFDNYLMTPNGRVHRLLTRLSVENLFHPFQAFMLGQKNIAPKMSVLHDIPLVFYGESEAEYGNRIVETESATRHFRYFTETDRSKVFIGGTSIAQLTSDFGLTKLDLEPYLPEDPGALEKIKTEVHYLGYYLKWHPQSCYYYAQEHGQFEPSPVRTLGTYSKYNSIDDRIDDFHYYTTYIKFGIGRATYDAAQEIRSGDINRDEGVALIRRYDGEYPERFAGEIFDYLTISENDFPAASEMFENPVMDREYFDRLADKFRSPHLWQYSDGEWSLRRTVWRSND